MGNFGGYTPYASEESVQLVVGTQEQLAEVNEFLRRDAQERPQHVPLFAVRGLGTVATVVAFATLISFLF